MRHQLMVKLAMIISIILGLQSNVYADDQNSEIEAMKQFLFKGTDIATIKLQEKKDETRYREEMQDSTCTRQVPYEEEVCGNVTYYRQVCHTVPARTQCNDYDEQVCHNETRYREECRQGPSRQVCRSVPGRRVCKPGPTQRRCRKLPSRQVCEAGVCRTIPGRQTCRNVPGPEVCHRNPSRRVCDTVSGDPICRDVPYTDSVCHTETRTQCDTIPSHEECDQVPYQEWECNMETRYRSENYACQVPVQIPYQVTVVTNSDVNFNFDNFGDEVESLFTINLENGKTSLVVKDHSDTPYYIFSKHEDQLRNTGDLEREMDSQYHVYFAVKEKALAPVNVEMEFKKLTETKLSFNIGKIHFAKSIKLSLVIKKKEKIILSTPIDLGKAIIEDAAEGSLISINLKDYNVSLKRGFGRKYDINVKVSVDPNLIHRAEILTDFSQDELTKEAHFKKKKPAKD